METKKQTNGNHRELTSTEIPLAVAEIVDRMSRLKKAHIEWWRLIESDKTYEANIDDLESKVKEKHDIPNDVPLMEEFGDPKRHDLIEFKRFANKWVRGKLTTEQIVAAYEEWDQMWEFDFCWVFTGVPAYYHNKEMRKEGDANILRWLKTGCRNNGGFKPDANREGSSYWKNFIARFSE